MKRLVGVLILLLLEVGVFVPAQSSFAQGGLDLNRCCSDKGWGRATLNGGSTAYDWKCVSGSTFHDMNLNEACQMQYGSGYTAEYRDFNDPNSWYCQAPANGGSGNPQNPEPGPNPVSRPNDPPPPSSTENISTCGNSYNTGVQVGGQARVTPGVANRIRSGAGTGYSRVGTAQPEVVFDVVGGPTCADGYKWWEINYGGTRGWTAEGDDSEAWIERVGNNGEWCSENPRSVANFGWDRSGHLLPNPRLELRFSSSTNFNDGSGTIVQPYYIYYNDDWVGSDVAQFQGWDGSEDAWTVGIDTTWYWWRNSITLGEEEVLNSDSWRVDYYRSDGICRLP